MGRWVLVTADRGVESYQNILAQTIINGYPNVDSFFFLSGLLVSYSVLREARRTNSFNVLLFYVHRFIRFCIDMRTRLAPALPVAPQRSHLCLLAQSH
ncbi:hypothetical protein O3P69_016255 [Scylla paramamosain]|uniref:Uncharacterized protein n=1 Tax=Scylla paramamosain TaxID=85552 RepID=A0AAW0S8T6_SCYPA